MEYQEIQQSGTSLFLKRFSLYSGRFFYLALFYLLAHCGAAGNQAPAPDSNQIIPAENIEQSSSQDENKQAATLPPVNGANSQANTKVTMGLKFHESSIDIIQGDLQAAKKDLNFLWTNKLENYAGFEGSDSDPEINSVLEDFSQCGLDYSGPSCLEGQEKQVVASGMFNSEDKTYVFFSFTYESESEKTYALLFPKIEEIETFPQEYAAYLYLVTDPLKAHSAADLFSHKAALPMATIHFSKLGTDAYPTLREQNLSMRQKLRVLHHQWELKKIFNEKKTQPLPLTQLTKELESNGIDINGVNDLDDNNTSLLYILYHEEMLSEHDFLAYLGVLTKSRKAATLAIQANLALLRRGEIDEGKYLVLNAAFSKGNRDLVRIAFWSLNFLENIPIEIRDSLVKLLGEARTSLAKKTGQVLLKYGIAASTVPLIVSVIQKKAKQDHTIDLGLTVLEGSLLPEVNYHVLKLLEHKESKLRDKVRQFLLMRHIEDDLLAELEKLFFSEYSNVQYLALELVDGITTEAATLVLINNTTIENDFRHAVLNRMVERQNFSDAHVDALAALFKSHFQELGPIALKLLLTIKTPKAANPVIEWLYSEKDLKVREEIILALYSFTFS